MNWPVNWEDLHHFLVLAETGSLSAAARRLGVDHTTVARHVTALEAALGLKLIDRLPRSVSLTAEGRHIAAVGERLDDGVEALLRAAKGMESAIDGEVHISAPPLYAAHVLTPLFARLRRRHPGLTISLTADVAAADLNRREADIALRLSRPDDPDLITVKLADMAHGLYAAPDYPREAADWAFVAHDGQTPRLAQQAWLDSLIGDRPVAFRSNDILCLAAAARAGLGVAVLPVFLAEHDAGLVRLPSPKPEPVRGVWLLVHDDLRRAPRIRLVIDALRAGLRQAAN